MQYNAKDCNSQWYLMSLGNKGRNVLLLRVAPSVRFLFFFPLALADLIMLGLATHEPNFTIIREEFKPNKPRPCAMCGQIGHEMKECQGVARVKQGEVIQQTSLYLKTLSS